MAKVDHIRDQIKRAYEYANPNTDSSDTLAKRVSDHEKGIINFGRI